MIHTPRVLAAALWQNLFHGKREHGRCVKMLGAHECANTHRRGPRYKRHSLQTRMHTQTITDCCSVYVLCDSTASAWFMRCFIPHGLRLRCDPLLFSFFSHSLPIVNIFFLENLYVLRTVIRAVDWSRPVKGTGFLSLINKWIKN